ncbi:TetR/AcrR family transcriptional regulator [Mesorhizobium sp. AaZ16]|uniref:TetR/AcrR family transcriptional regulator n=1 Tax=Mesorhizobium sp. AaZ16 TaxID=3402289 RepID=UPI00374E3412
MTENISASSKGRPRGFDRAEALRHAMRLFWAKGYDGASLADLTAVMGINPPSLYAAFGSKEALFREATDLYSETEESAFGAACTSRRRRGRQWRAFCVSPRPPFHGPAIRRAA